MQIISTTKMSSKGQVVIPEKIRIQAGLRPGDQFIVIAENDVVVLKTITPPSINEFSKLVISARKTAKSVGLKRSDITAAIKKARNKE